MRSPCYGCAERAPRCHAGCEVYLAWAAENEERRNQERAPFTVGGDGNRAKYARDDVRQRRYSRHRHTDLGGDK